MYFIAGLNRYEMIKWTPVTVAGLGPGRNVHQDNNRRHLHGAGLVAEGRHRAALRGRAQEHEPQVHLHQVGPLIHTQYVLLEESLIGSPFFQPLSSGLFDPGPRPGSALHRCLRPGAPLDLERRRRGRGERQRGGCGHDSTEVSQDLLRGNQRPSS